MLAVLVFAGIALRTLSNGEAVVPSRPLSGIPLEIAGWKGSNLELEQKVVDAVAVSDYVPGCTNARVRNPWCSTSATTAVRGPAKPFIRRKIACPAQGGSRWSLRSSRFILLECLRQW